MTEIRIDGKPIGTGQRTFVIAEVGVNHDGSARRAIELACVAAACGADAVKLQFFSPSRLVHPSGGLAEYQKVRGGGVAGGDAGEVRTERGRRGAGRRAPCATWGSCRWRRRSRWRTWRWWRSWGCRR